MSYKNYKAVFFDAGNTLLYPHPSIGEIYQEIAQKHGVILDSAAINSCFFNVWQNKNKLKVDPAKEEKAWWKKIVSEVVPRADFKDFNAFFDHLYLDFGNPYRWRLYEDVKFVLSKLRQKDIPMLIVSNWDPRLRKICAFHDLTKYFEAIIISAEIGVSKPKKKIFSLALEKVNCPNKDVIHIGDSVVDDIDGCRPLGIVPVYLNRHGEKIPGVWSVSSLMDII